MQCERCNEVVTTKRLKKLCRACLEDKKQLEIPRDNAIICKSCKSCNNQDVYIKLTSCKTCIDCRDKRKPKSEEEEDDEEDTEVPPKSSKSDLILKTILNDLKSKYNIDESLDEFRLLIK